MHRFFAPPEACRGATLTLDADESRHATQVLRLAEGAPVTVLDGAGNEWRGEIAAARKRAVEVRVVRHQEHPRPATALTLFQCVPKGRTMDWIVEKATELGAAQVVPVLSARSSVRLDLADAEAKRVRWQRAAIEALKQCGNPWLTRVAVPVDLPGALLAARDSELALVASLQPDTRTARACVAEFHVLHGRAPVSAALWIGPEGDFTGDEYRLIAEAGARPVSLGPLVLRCETAAVAGLAVLFQELASARG